MVFIIIKIIITVIYFVDIKLKHTKYKIQIYSLQIPREKYNPGVSVSQGKCMSNYIW